MTSAMTAEPMSAVTTTTRRNIIHTSAVSAMVRAAFAVFWEFMVQAVFGPSSRREGMVAHTSVSQPFLRSRPRLSL